MELTQNNLQARARAVDTLNLHLLLKPIDSQYYEMTTFGWFFYVCMRKNRMRINRLEIYKVPKSKNPSVGALRFSIQLNRSKLRGEISI